MPKSKSKSKSNALAVSYGGLPAHPGVRDLDPLLQARLGSVEPVRLPDEHAHPTAATVLKSEYVLTSSAAGDIVFAEAANLLNAQQVYTVTAGVLNAPTVTQHPQFVSFTAEAGTARTVLVRVQMMYIARTDSASGYLSYDEHAGVVAAGATVNELHSSSAVQVDAQDGLVVTVSHRQLPRWEAPAGGTYMANTFGVPMFVASGLPASTACYRVRVWRYVEYQPATNALTEGNQEMEPNHPAAMTVHGVLSGFATSVSTLVNHDSFLGKVRAAANAAYHIAAPLTPYVVGKARSFIKNLAVDTLTSQLGRLAIGAAL